MLLVGITCFLLPMVIMLFVVRPRMMPSYRLHHMPTDVSGRSTRDYAVDMLLNDFGPDMNTWPFEVFVQLPRITRHNTMRKRSFAEFIGEMREFGWHVTMQQNTLEEGARLRFHKMQPELHGQMPRRRLPPPQNGNYQY